MATSGNANRLPSATKGGAGSVSTPASSDNAWGGVGRRSSGSSTGERFSGLLNQKRNSADMSASARKASFDEQKPAPGFLGQMWNSFTKGTGPSGAASSGSSPTAK